MSNWSELQQSVGNIQMPDIGGMDGSTIQLILVVIIGIWLFRKLKSMFVIFLLITGFYYFMQLS